MTVVTLMSGCIHIKCSNTKEFTEVSDFIGEEIGSLDVNCSGDASLRSFIIEGYDDALYHTLLSMTMHLTFICE